MTAKKPRDLVRESARRNSNKHWHPERLTGEGEESLGATAIADLPEGITPSPYDTLVPSKMSWLDVVQREKALAEIIANETRRQELDIARRRLFTKAQVEEREKRYDDAIFAQFARIPEAMAALVEPEKKDDARAAGKALVTEIRSEVAKALRKRGAE